MENPRPEKVAVVEEVRARLGASSATVVTEYRGLTVGELATLRRGLAEVGGEYKIYKNTLVRRAVAESAYAPMGELLSGPTAIAFAEGDVSALARALREFARTHPHLVVKGGFFEGSLVSSAHLDVLADLPSREVLLAQAAGALQAPLAKLAGLLQALPRSLGIGLAALAEARSQEAAPGEDAG